MNWWHHSCVNLLLVITVSLCTTNIFNTIRTVHGILIQQGDNGQRKRTSYMQDETNKLNILIHSCQTCKGLKEISSKLSIMFLGKEYEVSTVNAVSSYSKILNKQWDIIFVGLNSHGCGNRNEATFIHEMRYLSNILFRKQPIFILIADEKNKYVCKTRNLVKYLDVDGIINYKNTIYVSFTIYTRKLNTSYIIFKTL